MPFTREEIRAAMRLYAVTDRSWLFGRTLAQELELALQNGVTLVQLREKMLPRTEFLAQAMEIRALTARYNIPLIINDDIDIALECGADGVHVGQSDLNGREARARIGPEKILGISANTVEAALAAQEAGADYLGVGAVFGTATKADAKTLSVEKLREICDAVDIPVVAIGGVSVENIPLLKGSGADGVAVISALFAQPDIALAAQNLRRLADALQKASTYNGRNIT